MQPGGAPVLSVERLALVFEALKAREDAERGASAPLIFNVDLKNKRKSHDLKDLYKRPLTHPHPSPPDPPWTHTRSRTTSACWLLSFFFMLFYFFFFFRCVVSFHLTRPSLVYLVSSRSLGLPPKGPRDGVRRRRATGGASEIPLRSPDHAHAHRTRFVYTRCVYRT